MNETPITLSYQVRTHLIGLERLEKDRWRVRIDGKPFASFCSESRARAAARTEARRLDFLAMDAAGLV